MYNSAQKAIFLEETFKNIETRDVHIAFFNKIEEYEASMGKDVGAMNASELSYVLSERNYLRTKSKEKVKSLLKSYLEWYSKNHNTNPNILSEVNFNSATSFSRNHVGSPEELQEYMDLIFRPECDCHTDIVYRCYMWLAYMGVPELDIFKITPKHVNFEKMSIGYNGMVFNMYDIATNTLRCCIDSNELMCSFSSYKVESINTRITGNQIVRGIRGNLSPRSYRTYITRRTKQAFDEQKTNRRLSYTKIWLSGLYYKKYLEELNGEEVDFSDIALYGSHIRSSVDEALEHVKNNPYNRAVIKQIAVEYEKDYNLWKQVFHEDNIDS